MSTIAAQITTPTVVSNLGGRVGVAVYDNGSVTNNAHNSVYILFSDGTYDQDARNNLTQVGTLTGNSAFSAIEGVGPGN